MHGRAHVSSGCRAFGRQAASDARWGPLCSSLMRCLLWHAQDRETLRQLLDGRLQVSASHPMWYHTPPRLDSTRLLSVGALRKTTRYVRTIRVKAAAHTHRTTGGHPLGGGTYAGSLIGPWMTGMLGVWLQGELHTRTRAAADGKSESWWWRAADGHPRQSAASHEG